MTERPLDGLKVVDAATLFAGPIVASLMADYGADVIKIEHPKSGDALRSLGWQKEGKSLWWLLAARNKRCVTLNLSEPRGGELLLELIKDADVFVENFRPGTLERWNVGPEQMHEVNPGLVIVRTTGFGQTGPYSKRPGYGTLAEAMSGFAHLNGWEDRPPALPPFALADGVAALTGTFAAMFALWWREHGGEGKGQVVDLSIFEPLFWLLGPQVTVYDQLGIVSRRNGNRTPFSAPRNAYKTKDGRWLALSGTSQSVAERVMKIIGREDLLDEPWFADHVGRLEHVDELDASIQDWIGARETDEVLAVFADQHAAIAPIYTIEDILQDPQYAAREAVTTVDDPDLGPVRMQNIIPRLSETPGRVDFVGRDLGADNEDIYSGLGLDDDQIEELRSEGVI
jgi:crotonobetainyl-CoA:carnitine CoA-transferase CaiB-like acyl-CoA transferase